MATFGGGRGGGSAPGGVETIDLCSDDDGGSDDEVQVVQVNRPGRPVSDTNASSGLAFRAGGADGAAASAGAAGGGGYVEDEFDPSCIPTIERYVHLPPSGKISAGGGTGRSGRPTVTGVVPTSSASASSSSATASSSTGKPKFVPKSKPKSKSKPDTQSKATTTSKKRKHPSADAGDSRAAGSQQPSRKRPAKNAAPGKRGTKISPPTDGMSLSQAHSLLFGSEHTSDGGSDADGSSRKNNKKKAKKSRSRSTSPATSIAAALPAYTCNTNPGRKRPGFGAMCKEMDRYLKSIANGRGWLTMSPDLAEWADEMREEYARYVKWKKTERLQGGGNGNNKRKRYRNRPQMTEDMVEKLLKIGFDLDESTGMSPPRKSRPSPTSRGAAALTVTQWNDDVLEDTCTTRGTGAGRDPKNSSTSSNSNSSQKKKRPRKKKKGKASDDASIQNDAASSNSLPSDSVGTNVDGGDPSDAKSSNEYMRSDSATLSETIVANNEDSSSLALGSNEGEKEKSPLRVYNDPGDPVCDIEIANQSECEDGADIGGEDENDERVNDEEFAFNYIPLVERIVMLDSETNQPLSPSRQPPPRTIGIGPIMSPPQKETASDSSKAQHVKAEGNKVGSFDISAESKGAQSTESLGVESTKPPAEIEEQQTQDEAVTKVAAKESAALSPSTELPTQHAKATETKEDTKKDPRESPRNIQDNGHRTSNAQDDSEAKKSCNDGNASDSQNNGDDQVSKLQAEVDALRAQLEEERRRRGEAEASRIQNSTNIVSGGEEEPDDGKEEMPPAKVKAEVIEIDDDEDDESADVPSKSTANNPVAAKPSPPPHENSIPDSQQVKQRMSDAVKTMLSHPDVALYDALCSAGFVFKEKEGGEVPTLVDENGVSLETRKEELSQLVNSEKEKCAQMKSNEAANLANNDDAKKQASLRQYGKSAQPSSRATASTNSSTSSAASTKSKTTTWSSDNTRQLASKQCCICKELHPQFRFSNEQWSKRNGYCHKCMVIERQKQAQTAWPPRQAAQWLHRRDRSSEKKKSSTAHRHEDYLYSQQEQQDRLFREAAERVKQQQRMAQQQQQQQQRPASSNWARGGGSSWVRTSPSYSAPVDDISKLPSNHWVWPDHHARLGLPKNATIAQIKKQFRKMALRYHPDKNSSSSSLQAWHAVKEAYESISS